MYCAFAMLYVTTKFAKVLMGNVRLNMEFILQDLGMHMNYEIHNPSKSPVHEKHNQT